MIPSLLVPLLAPVSAPDLPPPEGRYVEARTASVYAGACHFGGESVTAGREAVLAWRIERGGWNGVDLAGVEIAAVVAGDVNLAGAAAARRSVVHVEQSLAPDVAAAAVAWLAQTRTALVGDVVEVRSSALDVAVEGERYHARVPGAFELEGVPMPDRACCAMPQNVWYGPFERLEGRLVGLDAVFTAREPALGRAWTRHDANDAFVGRFGAR